jgi:hypothetical protein
MGRGQAGGGKSQAVRGFRFGGLLLNGVLLVASLGVTWAQECPYMNAATAAGIVGGEVKSSFVSSGVCDFATVLTKLRIVVETVSDAASQFRAYAARCEGIRAALPAIGNEAVACSHGEKDGLRVDQVIGRVRDKIFDIQLSTRDHTLTAAGLREKSKLAAEQVSGNLF